MNDDTRIHDIFERLQQMAQNWEQTTLDHFQGQPFRALIAAMLSARTREEDTLTAMQNLFKLADTPDEMLQLSPTQIRQAIARATFAETKAERIPKICQRLVDNDGQVPRTMEELMEYEGVGWKVAVLTLQVAFGIVEEICVDVHVGRIGKRMGLVHPSTKQPPKIARELEAQLPQAYWREWNPLMVRFGRNVCYPNHPACKRCPITSLCPKVGV